jgi:alpha-1,6-mannosyltransferase
MSKAASIFSGKSLAAIVMAVGFLVLIYFMGFRTPRESFNEFILLYIAAFAVFYMLWINRQQWNFKMFLAIAIIARIILLFSVPELSNDFYRFIWDGELITKGINPYAHLPNELISQGPFYNDVYMRMLYHGMGELSQEHYTCYPVFNQLLFYIPASLFDSIQYNVIGLKVIVILADIGAIMIGQKLLKHLNITEHNIWLYALNPFILMEFAGNLHFEGVMIFFLLLGIYYLLIDKFIFGGVFFALAIHIKLIPFILIPFVYKRIKWKRSLGFTALTVAIVLLLGQLMLNPSLLENFMESIRLYTRNFEFNASLFYLVRELGIAILGFDPIQWVGPVFAGLSGLLIMILALLKSVRNDQAVFVGMMFGMMIYYAFATTVHPWYISMILILSIFTRYKFALIWTLLVMLSYAAYANPAFEENGLFLVIEYSVLYLVMIIEIIRSTKKDDFALQLKSFFSD